MKTINYSVELKTAALTGVSGVIGKDIDVLTQKDNNGFPFFPATHIKGILKDKTEQIINTLNNFDDDKDQYSNLIDLYFGKEGEIKSILRFSDLTLSYKYPEAQKSDYLKDKIYFSNRHSIEVDRKTKTTKDGSLFNYEFINKNNKFNGTLTLMDDVEEKDIKLLFSALFNIDKIGGLKSRGLGIVTIKIEDKDINSLDELVNNVIKTENKKDKIFNENSELIKYNYQLTLNENIVLKGKEISNEIITNDIIQGSTLRGAIIQYFINEYNFTTKDIHQYILGKFNITQALPQNSKLTFASFFKCKYAEKCGNNQIINKLLSDKKECVCGNKLERMGVVYLKNNEKMTFNKSNSIGIEIDRKTRTSKDGKIYNKEILNINENNNIFTGEIKLSKELAEKLEDVELYIGKYKYRGFGKCKFEIKSEIKEEKINIKEKIEKLNNQIEFIEQKSTLKENLENKKIFTIDAISDIILPFSYIYNLGSQILELLNLNNFNVKPLTERTFANVEKMGGYNLINKNRKEDELIIKRGSVLTFIINNLDNDAFLESLNNIEKNGIGLRKDEGFGKIEIASPFHLEVLK